MGEMKRERRMVDAAKIGALSDMDLAKVARSGLRIVMQQNGKDVAALISAVDLERLEALDRRAADGWQTIQEIWARNAHLDPDEAERDIAEAIEEMRAETRATRSAPAAAPQT